MQLGRLWITFPSLPRFPAMRWGSAACGSRYFWWGHRFGVGAWSKEAWAKHREALARFEESMKPGAEETK